jgi:hypothetical protein
MSTMGPPKPDAALSSATPNDVPFDLPCAFFVLVLEPNLKAMTDRGRDIPLFRYDALVLPPQPGQRVFNPQADRQALLHLHEQRHLSSVRQGKGALVRLAEPHPSCNCHGWVFTEGRFGIQDPHVPSILLENGYEVVQTPQEGDLAIYRFNDAIKHSGVVRQSQPGGQLMVESKWGPFGAFLHAAESHPGSCLFYRSRRTGHLLSVGPIAM